MRALPVLTAVLQMSTAFWTPALPLRCPSISAVQAHECAPPSLRMQSPVAGAAEKGLLLRLRRRALHAAGCATSAGLLLPPHSPGWAIDKSAAEGAAPGSTANVQVACGWCGVLMVADVACWLVSSIHTAFYIYAAMVSLRDARDLCMCTCVRMPECVCALSGS